MFQINTTFHDNITYFISYTHIYRNKGTMLLTVMYRLYQM
jgi:hypothetical protein